MARKSSGRNAGNQSSSDWRDRLFTVQFSAKDEREIQEWLHGKDLQWPLCFEELVDSGWSVRVSPPGTGDDYWATATGKDVPAHFDMMSYTVRYPDAGLSVILLYYVITVWGEAGRLPTSSSRGGNNWLQT